MTKIIKLNEVKIEKMQNLIKPGQNARLTLKTTDGAILEIKKTNIKTIKPIVYEILDLNLIIYHYSCEVII